MAQNGSVEDLDLEEFLTHKTSGGGSAYLSNWKEDGKVSVWHHTKCSIATGVWTHRAPHILTFPDRQTGEDVNKTVSAKLVCWEDSATLKEQYKREADGTRKTPPERCGQCKFVDWIYMAVLEGRLNWMEPIFKFQGTDDEAATIVRAAHIYNGFSRDDLSEEQLKEMKKNRIFQKEAWKFNYFPKAGYIFRVCENAHPEKGIQIAQETALLGDKIKGVIGDQRETYGADQGNPLKNPYAIRWMFDKDQKEFGKKYSAKAMTEGNLKLPLTAEIKRLICDTDPPEINHLIQRFNALTWRLEMEASCLIDVPWDELYGTSAYGENYVIPGSDFDPAKLEAKKESSRSTFQVKSHPIADPVYDCDGCGKEMKASDAKCPHCGKEYEVEHEATPPPPTPPRMTRSQAQAAKSAPAKTAPVKKAQVKSASMTSKAPAAIPPQTDFEAAADATVEGSDDDIPF